MQKVISINLYAEFNLNILINVNNLKMIFLIYEKNFYCNPNT